MGTDWDETSLVYSDPRNSETAMDNALDRYRYILERRVVDTPGAHWTYCGGATALLARIIAKGSGKTVHEFARENLFDPLGLGPTEWATGPDGEPFAASGARMSVRDLAGIGLMMLHGGKVGERAVVPADWVTRCITPVISADEIRRYGYQWFLLDIAFGKPKGWAVGRLERMWMAQGEGGQRLLIIPALQLVIAMTAGNYGKEDQGIRPTRLTRRHPRKPSLAGRWLQRQLLALRCRSDLVNGEDLSASGGGADVTVRHLGFVHCEGFPMPAHRWRGRGFWGPALESLQGKNPRDVWQRTRRKRYGDFGVALVMGRPW